MYNIHTLASLAADRHAASGPPRARGGAPKTSARKAVERGAAAAAPAADDDWRRAVHRLVLFRGAAGEGDSAEDDSAEDDWFQEAGDAMGASTADAMLRASSCRLGTVTYRLIDARGVGAPRQMVVGAGGVQVARLRRLFLGGRAEIRTDRGWRGAGAVAPRRPAAFFDALVGPVGRPDAPYEIEAFDLPRYIMYQACTALESLFAFFGPDASDLRTAYFPAPAPRQAPASYGAGRRVFWVQLYQPDIMPDGGGGGAQAAACQWASACAPVQAAAHFARHGNGVRVLAWRPEGAPRTHHAPVTPGGRGLQRARAAFVGGTAHVWYRGRWEARGGRPAAEAEALFREAQDAAEEVLEPFCAVEHGPYARDEAEDVQYALETALDFLYGDHTNAAVVVYERGE